MSNSKKGRKELRAKLSQAMTSVLSTTEGVDSEKAAKVIRKTARKLAKELTKPNDSTTKNALAGGAVAEAAPGNGSAEVQSGQDKFKKKNSKKDKPKDAAGNAAPAKNSSRLVS